MSTISDRPSAASILRACASLKGLTGAQVEGLAAASRVVLAERAETIWGEGSSLTSFAIVGSGFVKMVRSLPGGQEVAAELVGPGQVLGLLALIRGNRSPLTARAVCRSWLLKVPKDAFMGVYGESLELRDRVLDLTTARLTQAHSMLARMSSAKVECRVASVLLYLAESYGVRTDDGLLVNVPLTRQDIAEMAGTTVESAIRTMSRWQKAGVLRTDHKLVSILDERSLSLCA